MQRIRDTFKRKRQATLETSEPSKESGSTLSVDKAQHSEPSSPQVTPPSPSTSYTGASGVSFAMMHPLHQSHPRAPTLEHFRQQLRIPLSQCDQKQLRSVSFDEIRSKECMLEQDVILEEGNTPSPSLEVPGATSSKSARSKSFDSATAAAAALESRARRNALEIPKWKMVIRRASATNDSPSQRAELASCVHCVLLEEYNRYTRTSLSPPPSAQCSMSSEGSQDADTEDTPYGFEERDWRSQRSASASGESVDDDDIRSNPSPIPLVTLSMAPDMGEEVEDLGNGITVISLEVPVLPKSGRSASVDSSYLQVPKRTDIAQCELPPGKSIRSRSVDIALPVGPDGPYIVVPNEKPTPVITQ